MELRLNVLDLAHRLVQACQTLFWQRIETLVVCWFEVFKSKNGSTWCTKPPNFVCKFFYS